MRQAIGPETWALLPFDSICPCLLLKNVGHAFSLVYLPKLPHGPQARALGLARKRPYHSCSLVSFYQILHIPGPRDFLSSCRTLHILCYFQALVSSVSSAGETWPLSFTLHRAECYTSFKCQLHQLFPRKASPLSEQDEPLTCSP